MSTSRSRTGSPTSKKFSSWVRPGVLEVRARALRPVSRLSSDDLPTLERPAKAISGTFGSGRNWSWGADLRNETGPEKSLGQLGLRLIVGAHRARGCGFPRLPEAGGEAMAAAAPARAAADARARSRSPSCPDSAGVEQPLLGDGQDVVGDPVELGVSRRRSPT